MAYTEFYVTKGGGANNLNGGGPNYAAGGAFVAAYANVDAVHNGAGQHDLDNNNGGAGWGATAVEDWICYDTGAQKAFAIVQVLSVGADDDVIRVQNLTGVAFTNLLAVNVNVGGAWADADFAAETISPSFIDSASSPPRVNIDSFAAFVEDVQVDNTGQLDIPITFQGFTTSAGDGGVGEIDGDLQGTQGTGCWDMTGVGNLTLRDLYVHTSDANIEAIYSTGTNTRVERCKIEGRGTAALWIQAARGEVFNCHVIGSNQGRGIRVDSTGHIDGNYVEGALTHGIWIGGHCAVTHNVVDSPGDDCIYCGTDSHVVANNTCYGSTGGSGIYFADLTGEARPSVYNNLCVSNNQYGIEVPAGQKYLPSAWNNAYWNNGVGETLNVLDEYNEVTLTGDPFVGAGAGNFALDNTAGEGAACRAAGFPGTMVDGVNIGYVDIGALQHQDAGGGAVQLVEGGLVG